MKYAIVPFLALGITLSMILGIEYNCDGTEAFPTYYGSPFVFKKESLGSSMEYFFSISGLVLNVLIWSFILFLFHHLISRLIKNISESKIIIVAYKVMIVVLIVFSGLNILITQVMIGRGFEKGLNYWYWDMNKEAKDWGMTCSGKWKSDIF